MKNAGQEPGFALRFEDDVRAVMNICRGTILAQLKDYGQTLNARIIRTRPHNSPQSSKSSPARKWAGFWALPLGPLVGHKPGMKAHKAHWDP